MRTNLCFALFAITATAACSNDEVIEPTFDNVYERVLAPKCTFSACHAAPTKAAQLDLTKEIACRELVNKPSCLFPNRMRIIPGHPEESFFFHKLTGEGLADVPSSNCSGETNALMPFGGSEIPEAEMQLVNAWIAAGASCDPGPDPKPPIEVGPSPISELRPNRLVPIAGESITVTVTLERPAPSGGQMIEIEAKSPSVFAPERRYVEGGASTVEFDAYAGRPTSLFAIRVTTGASVKELVLRVGGLSVAEVLNDPLGDDDNLQWIKLRNLTSVAIDLSRYRLRIGQESYDQTGVQLSGSIPAGGCMVVGGPSSSFANGEPVIGLPADFSPNLPVSGAQASGYAVFDNDARPPAGQVLTPVDTMLFGVNNEAQLLGPDAEVPGPFCDGAPEGYTVKRTGAGACIISEMRPNQCP